MTWWEVEQLAVYITDLEEALDDWTLSSAEMRTEQLQSDRIFDKIQLGLEKVEDSEKKIFLIQLANRIEGMQDKLTERLKREVRPGISPRNLLF